MKKIVIVESPTKARTIQKFLSEDFKTIASYGHVRDLPKSRFGIIIENNHFIPEYIIPPKIKKRIKKIKEIVQKANEIILATDEDREGEAIAWHLIKALELDEKNFIIKRIVFHEITQKAIAKALESPREINMDLVNAQQARRLLDRIVGYKLSPLLWKKIQRGLSAGRVQSSALRLIVEREREIANFKPQNYYSLIAHFQKDKVHFSAKLIEIENKKLKQFDLDKETAEKLKKSLKEEEFLVKEILSQKIKKSPPPPFITSTLQQSAWQIYKMPAKITMQIAQKLYEGVDLEDKTVGLITYMRTDSFNLAQEAVQSARAFIKENYGKEFLPPQPIIYKRKSKLAQEAHEAIRPTNVFLTPEKVKAFLTPNELKIYQLIWSRFVACQTTPAVFEKTTVYLTAQNTKFKAEGLIKKFDGFLKILPIKIEEKTLPQLTKNEKIKAINLEVKEHQTQPPPRYSEASLIKTLESYGIGRPSTYAQIISTIQERGYVIKNEKKLFQPTKLGILVNDLLMKHFPNIVDYQFTAKIEDELDEIAKGKLDWQKALQDFYFPFEKLVQQKLEEIEKIKFETEKKCPKCGETMIVKFSKTGEFLACSNFPSCNYTEALIPESAPLCPQCQKGQLIKKRSKNNKFFYGCSRYPDCQFAISRLSLLKKSSSEKSESLSSELSRSDNNSSNSLSKPKS